MFVYRISIKSIIANQCEKPIKCHFNAYLGHRLDWLLPFAVYLTQKKLKKKKNVYGHFWHQFFPALLTMINRARQTSE